MNRILWAGDHQESTLRSLENTVVGFPHLKIHWDSLFVLFTLTQGKMEILNLGRALQGEGFQSLLQEIMPRGQEQWIQGEENFPSGDFQGPWLWDTQARKPEVEFQSLGSTLNEILQGSVLPELQGTFWGEVQFWKKSKEEGNWEQRVLLWKIPT